MNTDSSETIDQALFGYADGHRQISASVRLPPKDLYLLSSASDLASGARLGERNSYLSGLPLPESRKYALFRTWAAPEMPRPGCVWSHVFLLDPKSSASIAALAEVLPFFRRPSADDTSFYGYPLYLPSSRLVEPARVDLISEIISGYYIRGRAILSPDKDDSSDIENAVLAVWSQQWPRLRSSFSFCTASLSESQRTEQSDYSVQVALLDRPSPAVSESWISFAAEDAAQNRVTPLRRFLWRYGRDISASRRQYRMIVELYLRSEGAIAISAETAIGVFRALPDSSDGAILKRDILGIGPISPRLVPPISALDFLKLLASETLSEPPTTTQVQDRLKELSSRDIGTVANYYSKNRNLLLPWKKVLEVAIISLAQKWSITTEYPRELITKVLLEREDLVDPDTLSLVESSDLPKFLGPDWSSSSFWIVVNEMLRRDLGDLEDTMLSGRPEVFFQSGVKAFCEGRLHQSWSDRIYSHSSVILSGNWLQQLDSTKELAVALSILRYPRNLAKNSAEISKRLSEIRDDAEGDGRTMMQAVLLRSAIDDGSAQSWSLISLVLPELRVVIVNGKLPRSAESVLSNDLPNFYSVGHWDINKRILLSLSKLNNFAPNNAVLATLGLNPEEMELVLDDDEYSAKKLSRKFWPWLY